MGPPCWKFYILFSLTLVLSWEISNKLRNNQVERFTFPSAKYSPLVGLNLSRSPAVHHPPNAPATLSIVYYLIFLIPVPTRECIVTSPDVPCTQKTVVLCAKLDTQRHRDKERSDHVYNMLILSWLAANKALFNWSAWSSSIFLFHFVFSE